MRPTSIRTGHRSRFVSGRSILIASLLSMAGLWAWVSGQEPDGGGVHGTVQTWVLRDRIATFVDATPAQLADFGTPIDVPKFEVHLVNAAGTTVASAVSDVFGRFYFRYQPPGSYTVCWDGRGWVAGCSPEKIDIRNNITYMEAFAVHPARTTLADGTLRGAFWGRVSLADGSSPFFAEEYFEVLRTADVSVTDLQGTVLGQAVTNAQGEYVLVGLPETVMRLAARLDGGRAALLTPPTAARSGEAIPLMMSNTRPILTSVAARSAGNGVREAMQGAQLDVATEVRDPDGDTLTFVWKPGPGSGRLVSSIGPRAVWELAGAPGQQTMYLIVSDGQGGYTTGQVTIRATAGNVTIAGKAVMPSGVPIAKPTVTVNGNRFSGDANGAFVATVPLSNRYVVNVSAPGFALASRIFDQSGIYQVYRLPQTNVTLVDPAVRTVITDRRREGRDSRTTLATVRLDPGSLVGRDGKVPAGPIQARITTLDVANAEMPGDFNGRSSGKAVGLLSYGAMFAEFVDGAGNPYNLAAGKTAEVTLPVPVSLTNPPATIALWSYNEQTGYWDDLRVTAKFDRIRRAYVGRVPHFSTLNADIAFNNAACIRILLDNIQRSQLKVRVAYVSGGTPFGQTPEFELGDALNAIYALPANTNVRLTVIDKTTNLAVSVAKLLDVNQQVLANNVVNTGAATANLFPDTPYTSCVTTSVRLDVPAGTISRIPFLSFMLVGTEANAIGYYKLLDPLLVLNGATWSGGTHSTLGDWWAQAGFTTTGGGGTRASYLNHNDLGFGRDMHVRKSPNGDVFAYVTNYGKPDQSPQNADDAVNPMNLPLATQGATVAMEFTSLTGITGKVVKFFVFSTGQPSGKLVNSADLDGFGQKFVPNLCTTCHGGEVYFPGVPATPTAVEVSLRPSANSVGASFREFDTDSFKYPGGIDTLPAAARPSFYDLNQLVKDTSPQPAITALINGWYGSRPPTDPPDTAFTPPEWIEQAQPQKQLLYQQVVARSCRTCHLAFNSTSPTSGLNWATYQQFKTRRGRVQATVCGDFKVMPHALIAYRNFWLLAGPYRPDALATFTASDWAAFGTCK